MVVKKGYVFSSLESRLARMTRKTDSCWHWLGAKNLKGYGQIFKDGKIELAHRVYFEKAFGHIPKERELNHLCKTPGCVNPAHLEAVTHKQNMAYSYEPSWNPLKERCKHGHPLSGKNLLFWSGKRHC